MKALIAAATVLVLLSPLMPLRGDDLIGSGNLERRITLEELQEHAAGYSPELEKLRSAQRQSRIDLAEARSGRWPEISFLATGTYLFNPMDEMTAAIPDGPTFTIMEAQEPTYYQFGLQLTQPIFTWGKIHQAVRLHELLLEVRSLEVFQKQRELNTAAVTLAHSLFFLEEMLQTADEQVRLALRLSEITRDSFDQGFIVEEELLSARLQVRELELLQRELQREIRSLLRQLELLTGVQGLSPDEIAHQEISFTDLGSETDVIGRALSGDREIFMILNLLREVQDRALKISQASMYWKPDLALQIEAGYESSQFPFIEKDWYRQEDYSFNVTVALETTLWDGGRRIQEVKRSREEVVDADITLREARHAITEEVSETYLHYELNRSRMEYHDLKGQLFADRIASSRRQFESGAGSEPDLLALQLESLGHDLQSLRTRIDAVRGYLTLLHMTGEDF